MWMLLFTSMFYYFEIYFQTIPPLGYSVAVLSDKMDICSIFYLIYWFFTAGLKKNNSSVIIYLHNLPLQNTKEDIFKEIIVPYCYRKHFVFAYKMKVKTTLDPVDLIFCGKQKKESRTGLWRWVNDEFLADSFNRKLMHMIFWWLHKLLGNNVIAKLIVGCNFIPLLGFFWMSS